MAVKCTGGRANPVLMAMFEANIAEAGYWSWPDFKQCLIQIEDNYRRSTRGAPQDVTDGDFHSEDAYATAALAVTLIGVGTGLLVPAVTLGVLGAIGLGSGGAAAACLQYAICGGVTGSLFPVFSSLGATILFPSLFTTFAGFGTAAAGAWLGFAGGIREDPLVRDS